jgi:hypothetical protein
VLHLCYGFERCCTALPVGGSRDRSPVVSLAIFSVATDGTMCPGVDSASKNEYQDTPKRQDEREKWRKDKAENVSSCWMTLKGKNTRNWNRKRQIAMYGELALERTLDLSQDWKGHKLFTIYFCLKKKKAFRCITIVCILNNVKSF